MVEQIGPKRFFNTLDGLRGVAAVAILIRHCPYLFGNLRLPDSQLSVDLFFVLSGFVLAHAYGRRLQTGLSTVEFMKIRLIRLYPLYGLGTLVGIAAVGMSLIVARGQSLGNHDALTVTARTFGPDAMMALFMLPALPMVSPVLYPLNQPAWSLFFELIGNAAYGVISKLKTFLGLVVGAIILCSAVGIIYYDFKLGGIGDGFSWNYAVEGLSRIGFSFPLGIVLYKVPRVNLNIPPFVLCVLLVLILVGLPKGTGLNIYPLFCIFVLFPLLVTLAAAAEPSENLRSIFSFLGMASYGIYATHKPVEEFVIGAALRVLHLRLDQFAPFSGLIFLAAILTAIGLIDTYFDRPVRRWLTQKSNRATPESSAAVEAVG